MSSLRELPQQFGQGLDVSATRIEQNVNALEQFRQVPPKFVERRQFPSWLVWGYQSDTKLMADHPWQFPWLREKNASFDLSTTYTPAPTVTNTFRHKGVFTPGIGHTTALDALYCWEVSFETKEPTHLTKLYAFMLTDSNYVNSGAYAAPAPPSKTAAQSLNDVTLQVFVDDTLDPELRARTSVEAGSFNLPLASCLTYANPIIPGGIDTMQPPHPTEIAHGWRFTADCDVLLPVGRIRVALVLPRYTTFSTGWGTAAYPWQTGTWSIGLKLSEGTHG